MKTVRREKLFLCVILFHELVTLKIVLAVIVCYENRIKLVSHKGIFTEYFVIRYAGRGKAI